MEDGSDLRSALRAAWATDSPAARAAAVAAPFNTLTTSVAAFRGVGSLVVCFRRGAAARTACGVDLACRFDWAPRAGVAALADAPDRELLADFALVAERAEVAPRALVLDFADGAEAVALADLLRAADFVVRFDFAEGRAAVLPVFVLPVFVLLVFLLADFVALAVLELLVFPALPFPLADFLAVGFRI